MIKRFTYLVVALCLTMSTAWAQTGSISGTVVDDENGDGLISATVLIQGTSKGAVTDVSGAFSIDGVNAGSYTLVISFIGYSDYTQEVTVNSGSNTDVGEIRIQSGAVGLDEVMVIADIAIDRKTPVAVSTIRGAEISEKVGNQEFPEILKYTPSIYATKQGGGWGDARINVRGFNQRNTAVMINGIPVNDMENGWVYWSNWAGLSDVSSAIQVQRGLSASRLAISSVGGTINIVTNAAMIDKGGSFTASIGNDGYNKYALSLNSGLMSNGWAFSFQGTRTQGDGYVNGTAFSGFSYFLSASKQINSDHTIVFTALGAPQWHHQRLWSRFDNINLGTFAAIDPATGKPNVRYNDLYGSLDGEEFSWRKNFYHKPKAFLNHYWTINETMELSTSAYYSLGNGGGTGPRGRGANFNFDSSPVWRNTDGTIRWDDINAWQSTNASDPDWGQNNVDGTYGNYTTSSGPGLIRRASMNYHTWYGVISTLNKQLNENLNLTAGVDLRSYTGEHFRRVENLLGLDSYRSRADDNQATDNFISDAEPADFGNFRTDGYKRDKGANPNVINYWNDGVVRWYGFFTQLEYSNDKLSAFVNLSGSSQGFKRIDYFNYLDDDPLQESPWNTFNGGTIKLGANYNIDSKSNIYFNTGVFSQQPLFDAVYLNFVNQLNPEWDADGDTKLDDDVTMKDTNQSIQSFELGYGYTTRFLTAKINAYSTSWGNRSFDVGVELANDEDGLAVFTGVSQLHQGIELELVSYPTEKLQLRGMMSLGNWRYTDNLEATITNIDQQVPAGTLTIFAAESGEGANEDLRIGDAAQTTFGLRADLNVFKGFNIYADYYFADDLFANWSIDDTQFQSPGGEILQLPSYSLIDAGFRYTFIDNDNFNIRLNVNVNNVLDEFYISELYTNNPDLLSNEGFYGFGRTWNAGLRVRFK